MTKEQKRNPVFALQFTLSNTKDYLEKLCELRNKQNELKIKLDSNRYFSKKESVEWEDIALYIRAIKTSLILEIGKLFDTYYCKNREVISFKTVDFFQIPSIKKEIDSAHREAIISEILKTRNTWSAHIGINISDIISTEKICQSNLSKILKSLDDVTTTYIIWYNQNKKNVL